MRLRKREKSGSGCIVESQCSVEKKEGKKSEEEEKSNGS